MAGKYESQCFRVFATNCGPTFVQMRIEHSSTSIHRPNHLSSLCSCIEMMMKSILFVCITQLLLRTTLSFSVRSTSSAYGVIHKLGQSNSLKMATEPIGQDLLDEVLSVAIDASKKAGGIILGNAGGAEVTSSKANSRDLLTMIDPLCEKVTDSLY